MKKIALTMFTNSVRKYFLLVVFLLFALPFQNASATVISGYIFESTSSKVFINLFVNHNYYSRDIPFRYTHQVEALEVVHATLSDQGKIQDIPILIFPPSQFFTGPSQHTLISLKANCSINSGDAAGDSSYDRSLGVCYEMYVEEELNHENLLVLTLELQKLEAQGQQREISNIDELKQELSADLKEFQSITLDFDPIPSPDGRFHIAIAWKDGQVRFELSNQALSTTQTLEFLEEYMAVQPIWSPDSQYVAYASLDEIKIFDVDKNTTETLSISSLFEGSHVETLISFQISENKLTFAGDTNLLDDYKIYEYDLISKTINSVLIASINLGILPEDWERSSIRYEIDSKQSLEGQTTGKTNKTQETIAQAESRAITSELCCSEIFDSATGKSVLPYTHLKQCQDWSLVTKEQCRLFVQEQESLNQNNEGSQSLLPRIVGLATTLIVIVAAALYFRKKKLREQS
jgi:hypothetical protein